MNGSPAFAVVVGALAFGCGSILGTDGFEEADCVGPCADAGANLTDAAPDGAAQDGAAQDGAAQDGAPPGDGSPAVVTEATDASPDASVCAELPPCESGRRIAVRVQGAGNLRISSDPGGISAGAGETASACFRDGARLRLAVSDESARATFDGVECEDGNTSDKCEFSVSRSVCVVATLP